MSSINIQEVSQDGLSKTYKVIVPNDLYKQKHNNNLIELQKVASIPGFRTGKAPINILKRKFGSDIESDTFKDILNEGYKYLMETYKITPATQPKINVNESNIDKDFEFIVELEESPKFDIPDFSQITVDRYNVKLSDTEILATIQKIIDRSKPLETENNDSYKLHKGDVAIINFIGKIDGKAFEGGTAEGHSLEIGSGEFIPGFEDQLIGKKIGDHVQVKVTFPDNYHAENLKGKDAIFDVDVIEIKRYGKPFEINDELSAKLGFKPMSLEEFKEFVRNDKEKNYKQTAYDQSKLSLFNTLETMYKDLELPKSLVEQELEAINKQHKEELKDENEILRLARRRVALGLFLLSVAETNKITYTEQDIRNLIFEKARALPGFEMQVIELFNTNKALVEQLKTEVIENKTVSFIMEKANIKYIEISEQDFLEKI